MSERNTSRTSQALTDAPFIETLESRVFLSGDAYEVDNTAAQAHAIAVGGAAQTHSIHVKTDVDWVKFTLTATTPVIIQTAGKTGDTRMWLYNSAIKSITSSNDISTTNKFSQISTTLSAGTYFVKIDGNNAVIPSYTVKVSTATVAPTPLGTYNVSGKWTVTGSHSTETSTFEGTVVFQSATAATCSTRDSGSSTVDKGTLTLNKAISLTAASQTFSGTIKHIGGGSGPFSAKLTRTGTKYTLTLSFELDGSSSVCKGSFTGTK